MRKSKQRFASNLEARDRRYQRYRNMNAVKVLDRIHDLNPVARWMCDNVPNWPAYCSWCGQVHAPSYQCGADIEETP